MANLMLVQCVIASHVTKRYEICKFGLVSFGDNSIRSLTVTMVRSQKEWQCQLKVNIMSNRKKVTLTKDAPLSSHLADYTL